MAVNDMIVRIIGDSRSVERAFARSSTAANQFNRNITTTGAKIDSTTKKFSSFAKGTAVGFGGALAVTEGITQLRVAVDVASNLQEQISRVGVTFGAASAEVEKWSETTANGIGLAKDQALAAAAAFGGLFAQSGSSEQAAARLSERVVTLGADLASFANVSVDEALTALRSGLSGEIEPLRRFEVFLTEAAVAQRAMADSGKDNVKQLTQGEKIMARWNLILEQTTRQQGDSAKTAGNYAGQMKRLAANAREAQGQLGQVLLPVLTDVAGALNTAATAAVKFTDALGGMEKQSDRITFGDLFTTITGIPDLFEKSLIPPWKWDEVAESQRAAADNAFATAFAGFGKDGEFDLDAIRRSMDDTFEADGVFNIPAIRSRLQGRTGESGDAAAQAREILNRANGNLGAVLAGQIKRRDALGKLLVNARKNFQDQKKIDDLAVRYANSQASVIDTQKEIASNDKQAADAARDAAKTAAETARATALANRERAKSLEQIRQFRALGLDATGAKPPPTIANLLKQITSLSKTDITKGERGVLARIRKTLIDPLHKATPETRAAAKGLIDGLRDELDVEKKLVGPLTRTSSLNANKMLSGILGITPEAERELRQRLSKFNSAGLSLAGARGPTGQFRGGVPSTTTNVTVEIDGEAVGRATRKTDQKNRRRNPVQKRGSRRGGV